MEKEQVIGTFNLATGDQIPTDLSNEGLIDSTQGVIRDNVLDLRDNSNTTPFIDLDKANQQTVTENINYDKGDNLTNDQNNPVTSDNNTNSNTPTNQPVSQETGAEFDDYSHAALFSKLLGENGLAIFDDSEFKKDLSPVEFVEQFKNKTSVYTNNIIKQELDTLGSIKAHVEAIYHNNISPDVINPLINLQRYADMDMNDNDLIENDIIDSVKSMYKLQGVADELIPDLIEMDKEKGVLVSKGTKSKEIHNAYINNTLENIKKNKEFEDLQARQQQERESAMFVGKLRSIDTLYNQKITDSHKAAIFDNIYKRDQLVNIQGEDNRQEQVLMTKYELLMYNIVNDPEKFIKLNYLLLNDLNYDSTSNNDNSINVNKKIIDALEKGKGRVVNNVRNINPNGEHQHQQQRQNDDVIMGTYSLTP